MKQDVSAFKAYDIRGIYPNQINATFMRSLAFAFATHFSPQKVVIGRDSRLSGKELSNSLSEGFREMGVDVLDLGLCGTEMVYYATGKYETDGGLMITASHNPANYNGCKMVTFGSVPVGAETGLREIRQMVENNGPFSHTRPEKPDYSGSYTLLDIKKEFAGFMLSLVPLSENSSLKVVVNAGNGAAGPIINELSQRVPFSIGQIFEKPDGSFPNGVPNPLLPECRNDTSRAVIAQKADLGVAFDGDYDRCFFFDENGRFIEGYYIVGLLARQVLAQKPGVRIIHDPRLTWNTIDIVKASGGIPVECKTGHVFIKERMRMEKAEYGGEMSAHHYFKKFWYCDTGILPFLWICDLLINSDKPFSKWVDDAFNSYPVSGELNYTIGETPLKVMQFIEKKFQNEALRVSKVDGLSMDFRQWRFNLRPSNTEPLLRLNVESRGDIALMQEKRDEIAEMIKSFQ